VCKNLKVKFASVIAVTIGSVACIIGKFFEKAFTKLSVGKVFIVARIHPQSGMEVNFCCSSLRDFRVRWQNKILSGAKTTHLPPMRKEHQLGLWDE
jgi:hypothetical protein